MLKEQAAAIGAGFTVSLIAEGIIRSEPFGGFAAAQAAGDVKLPIHDVLPQRANGSLVIAVAGLFAMSAMAEYV